MSSEYQKVFTSEWLLISDDDAGRDWCGEDTLVPGSGDVRHDTASNSFSRGVLVWSLSRQALFLKTVPALPELSNITT